MSKYKVRFNLGRGENFMKWKVTSPNGDVEYYSPDHNTLVMNGCKLRNSPATAQKIHDGANKTVCAWIDADHVSIHKPWDCQLLWSVDKELRFNPRDQPHWSYAGDIRNIDNQDVDLIITQGRRLWDVATNGCCDE
jgi:hypothetical protein